MISPLPRPARFIIEDMIRGVVNPNIIHDELQATEARGRCVRVILSLHEDVLGALDL